MLIAFGGGIILEQLHKRERFYLRNLLKLNRLYSKYQSNLMVMLMLFSLDFIVLGYCMTGIASLLPVGGYEKDYPYSAVWMAQEKEEDRIFTENLIRRYKGTVRYIPMIRVSNYSNEEIGISETTYKELTGKTYGLKERQIIVASSERGISEEKEIESSIYRQWFKWLVMGKYTQYWLDYTNSPETPMLDMDTKYHYEIQRVHTQNWFGAYGIDWEGENVIVFPDEYFHQQRSILLDNPEESTMLELFTFPREHEAKATEELKNYVKQYGVQDEGRTKTAQSSCYITGEFCDMLEKTDIFTITSKLFIVMTLFVSGKLVLMIKTMAEIPSCQKRYEFLEHMGIRRKMRKKVIRAEVKSIPRIASLSAALLSVAYVRMYIICEGKTGARPAKDIWGYWLALLFLYLMAGEIVQSLFSLYVNHKTARRER